jgi:hypothetical protein
MSYIGTTEIGKMFLGSVEIDKAYLGDDLVFSSASGPAPIAPEFYNYLYFDGTAYVNTDYYLPKLCSIRVSLGYESKKVAQRVFMANGSSAYISFIYGSATTSTNRRINIYYGSTSNLSGVRNLSFSHTTFGFFLTPKCYGWGNSSYTISKGSGHPTDAFQIGGWGSGQPFTGRMATIRIYGSDAQNVSSDDGFDSYTPVATFRPCTYNGDAGLWCVETSTFYGNTAGAGTLTVSNNS